MSVSVVLGWLDSCKLVLESNYTDTLSRPDRETLSITIFFTYYYYLVFIGRGGGRESVDQNYGMSSIFIHYQHYQTKIFQNEILFNIWRYFKFLYFPFFNNFVWICDHGTGDLLAYIVNFVSCIVKALRFLVSLISYLYFLSSFHQVKL